MKNEAEIFKIVFCSWRHPVIQVSIKSVVSAMGNSEILGDLIWTLDMIIPERFNLVYN